MFRTTTFARVTMMTLGTLTLAACGGGEDASNTSADASLESNMMMTNDLGMTDANTTDPAMGGAMMDANMSGDTGGATMGDSMSATGTTGATGATGSGGSSAGTAGSTGAQSGSTASGTTGAGTTSDTRSGTATGGNSGDTTPSARP